jgi:hypothetical protein
VDKHEAVERSLVLSVEGLEANSQGVRRNKISGERTNDLELEAMMTAINT